MCCLLLLFFTLYYIHIFKRSARYAFKVASLSEWTIQSCDFKLIRPWSPLMTKSDSARCRVTIVCSPLNSPQFHLVFGGAMVLWNRPPKFVNIVGSITLPIIAIYRNVICCLSRSFQITTFFIFLQLGQSGISDTVSRTKAKLFHNATAPINQ